MLNELNYYFQLFSDFTKENPVASGVVSLWGLGVLTFILKGVPKAIWNFVTEQCTTTLTMSNVDVGLNQEVFNNFIIWLNNSKWSRWSRSLSVDGRPSQWTDDGFKPGGVDIGIGEGTHFFVHKGRFFWVTRYRIEKQGGVHQIFYEIRVTLLGRKRDLLKDLYHVFNPPVLETNLSVYTHTSENGWARLTQTQKRSLESVITSGDLLTDLRRKIEWFKSNKQWYLDRGLPYKLVFVLHGPPGTGKSSIIKALASHFNASMCLYNLSEVSTGKEMMQAFATTPENSFVLCEDFDDCTALTNRGGIEDVRKKEPQLDKADGKKETVIDLNPLSLSAILNAFDGVVSLNDSIFFLTTNKLDVIDPAFLRPGRVDRLIYVGALQHEDICRYIGLMFPTVVLHPDDVFEPLPGCRVQEIYFEHRDNYQAFIDALPKIKTARPDLRKAA